MPKGKAEGKAKSSDYTLITIEENHALELRNEHLLSHIRNTVLIIKDAEVLVQKLKDKDRKDQEWIAYLACDPLPKPHQPEIIRAFFYKAFHFETEDVELSYNWQLAQDERSILSQDIDALDLTGRNLKQNQKEFGSIYAKYVADTIAIIKRIQKFLERPTKVVTEHIINDLEEVMSKAYDYIAHFIDSLASRVLCSETAYMDQLDATSAQYSYHGEDFGIHIWTYLNVPIFLDPVETPFKVINLSQIRTKLTVPFSVLCENMVIRGVHSKFDNYSPHCRYYSLPKPHHEQEINLARIMKNEWDEQMTIQAEIKAALIKARAEYEEAMRLKAEEEEAKARMRKKEDGGDKGKQQDKKKPKKPPKEPQIVEPNQVPIVRQDFLKHNQREYEDEIAEIHPRTFRLIPGEINLRKYQILGGVYQLESLEKPTVTNFPRIIMTWYTPKVRIEVRPTPKLEANKNDISKFFEIQFHLPASYCYWGQPIPCIYEAKHESKEVEKDLKLTQLNVRTPIIINDFNLHELFTKPMMYDFIENSLPLLISSFKLPEDFHDEEEDKKKGKTLGRTKMSAEEKQREAELALQKQMLSYDAQYCPERLFPLFKKVLPVTILPLPESAEGGVPKKRLHPYEHFSDFLEALQKIKENYRKSTFKDRHGNVVKILAEHYDRNIRRPRKEAVSSKYMLFDEDDKNIPKTGSLEKFDSDTLLAESTSNIALVTDQPSQEVVKAPKVKKGKGRLSKSKIKDIVEEVPVEEPIDPTSFSKWSTSNILRSEVRVDQKRVTILTDRLGTFGFAFKRYQHFPFKSWTLQPYEYDPEIVELAIETVNVMFRFHITPKGYIVCASDFVKYYKNRKIYMEIKEPIPDLKEVIVRLQDKFLNIFPERDFSHYMEGYFSEKHLAAECHAYECMCLYAKSLKFFSSIWNKLSDRRSMIIRFGELRDLEEDMFLLKITPEDVLFVEIKELCTELDVISLSYTPTWRNLEWYADLNNLIMGTFNNAIDMQIKDPHVLYYLKNLLIAIRPLSCS